MDNTIGLASALVAMQPDEEGHRYEDSLMLSALPNAPIITEPTRGERLVAFVAGVRTRTGTRTATRADGRIHGGSQAIRRLESA